MSEDVEKLKAHARDDRATAKIQRSHHRHDVRASATADAYDKRADDLEQAASALARVEGERDRLRSVLEEIAGHGFSYDSAEEAASWMQDAALSALSAGQVRGGESRDHAPAITAVTSGQADGWRDIATDCFECGRALEGPWCPACNPEMRPAWRDITSAPLAHMVLLWHPVWRHAFPGIRNGEGDAVWVDTCEPDARGWQTRASHWMPLPPPPAEIGLSGRLGSGANTAEGNAPRDEKPSPTPEPKAPQTEPSPNPQRTA